MHQSKQRAAAPAAQQASSGAAAASGPDRRQLRRRRAPVSYLDQHPELDALLGAEDDQERSGSGRQLDVAALRQLVEHTAPAATFPAAASPSHLTAEALAAAGLRQPLLVPAGACGRGAAGAAATRTAMGLHLPAQQLTPRGLAEAIGPDHQVHTIDVVTQESGPRLTLSQLADYLAQQAQQAQQGRPGRLLNVTSLVLAGTPLEGAVSPPAGVQQLDLVAAVWPEQEEADSGSTAAADAQQRPETLLYALLGPAGAYTDWHVDMGGSAVWYHVVSGRKVFLAAPPTPANLAAFEQWSCSDKQASSWLGERLSGLVRLDVGPGDTLVLPSAWPHAVSTPEASVAVGGNFLHAFDYSSIAGCYRREQRLGVTPKFQFPLFRRLMWHAAHSTLLRLRQCVRQAVPPSSVGLSAWELQGLPALSGLLREWLQQGRRGADVPSIISDPAYLLEEMGDCLDTLRHQQGEAVLQPPAAAAEQPWLAAQPAQQQVQQELFSGPAAADEQLGGLDLESFSQEAAELAPEQPGLAATLSEPAADSGLPASLLAEPLIPQDRTTAGPAGPAGAAAGAAAATAGAAVPEAVPRRAVDPRAARAAVAAWAMRAVLGGGDYQRSERSPQQQQQPQQPKQQEQQQQPQPHEQQQAAPAMVPLAEAGGGGSPDELGGLFFDNPSPAVKPRTGAGASRRSRTSPQQAQQAQQQAQQPQQAQQQGKRARGRKQQPSESEASEELGLSSEEEDSSDEDSLLGSQARGAGSGSKAKRAKQAQQARPRSRSRSRSQPPELAQPPQQTQQRRRLRKAGEEAAAAAEGSSSSAAKKQKTGEGGAAGKSGGAPSGSGSKGGAASKDSRMPARSTRTVAAPPAAAAAAAAAGPIAPPPIDVQPLGRKHLPGYTISLSARRQQQAQQAQQAQPSRAAATARAADAAPRSLQRQQSGGGTPTGAQAEAQRVQAAAVHQRAGERAEQRVHDQREAERQQRAAEESVNQLLQLAAAVKREEELLVRVQSGVVSLPDGGSKLASALAQRKEQLQRKRDAAEGRLLTYADASTGKAQGPFTPHQLQQLLRAGVVQHDTPVQHPNRGTMPLSEAVLLPEPLTAQLLRQREQQQQRGGGAPAGGRGGGPVSQSHSHGPQQSWPRQRWGGGGGRGGGWRAREEERRRQQQEWEEHQRRQEQEAAAAEEEAAAGLWTFVNDQNAWEGPYTVAELRQLVKQGELTDDVMLHEPDQGLSMRLFTLLDYPALAEVSRRQREVAAARAAAEAAAQSAAAAATDTAAAAAAQHGAGEVGRGPGGQVDWAERRGSMDGSGGGGGGGGGGEAELYEPSPTYDQPASPPRHYTTAPELYSPSRADWDDEEEEAQPTGQQAGQQAQQARQGLDAEVPPGSAPLLNEAILEAAGDYPAGYAPRVVLPEVAMRILRTSASQPGSPAAAAADSLPPSAQAADARGPMAAAAGAAASMPAAQVPAALPMQQAAGMAAMPAAPLPAAPEAAVWDAPASPDSMELDEEAAAAPAAAASLQASAQAAARGGAGQAAAALPPWLAASAASARSPQADEPPPPPPPALSYSPVREPGAASSLPTDAMLPQPPALRPPVAPAAAGPASVNGPAGSAASPAAPVPLSPAAPVAPVAPAAAWQQQQRQHAAAQPWQTAGLGAQGAAGPQQTHTAARAGWGSGAAAPAAGAHNSSVASAVADFEREMELMKQRQAQQQAVQTVQWQQPQQPGIQPGMQAGWAAAVQQPVGQPVPMRRMQPAQRQPSQPTDEPVQDAEWQRRQQHLQRLQQQEQHAGSAGAEEAPLLGDTLFFADKRAAGGQARTDAQQVQQQAQPVQQQQPWQGQSQLQWGGGMAQAPAAAWAAQQQAQQGQLIPQPTGHQAGPGMPAQVQALLLQAQQLQQFASGQAFGGQQAAGAQTFGGQQAAGQMFGGQPATGPQPMYRQPPAARPPY